MIFAEYGLCFKRVSTSLDASAFGILINTVHGPIESPLKEYGKSKKNLTDYCERMMEAFFPEYYYKAVE